MVVIMIILLRQVVTGQVNGAVRERERGKVWARLVWDQQHEKPDSPVAIGGEADVLPFVEDMIQRGLLNVLGDQGAENELLLLHRHGHAGPGGSLRQVHAKSSLERHRRGSSIKKRTNGRKGK